MKVADITISSKIEKKRRVRQILLTNAELSLFVSHVIEEHTKVRFSPDESHMHPADVVLAILVKRVTFPAVAKI